MNFNRVKYIIFITILILSIFPPTNVAEAKKQNQANSLEATTVAVEKAEQYRTWEYVNLAQIEIDSLGNSNHIRAYKNDLQNRLDIVKVDLVQKDSELIEEENPVAEEPINDEVTVEIPEKPIIEEVQEPVYHVVESGDTLWLISVTYGVSVSEIKELNDLTSDVIYVGQVLLISTVNEIEEGIVENNPVEELMILGFYTKYWSTDLGSYNSLTSNHQYLNSIATASVDVNYDGNITGFIPKEALDFSNENNVFTYATFQNHYDPNLTREIFNNSFLQETVISNMVSFVKEHGFKGANLNFENMYASDRSLFNDFVEKMTAHFQSEGYPVMISVPAKTCDCPTWAWSGTFDFEFLGNSNVDYIQVMSYDQHGSWSSPGSIAGYDWMNSVLNYATNHISSNKILLGLPAYGYDWNTSNNSGNQAVTLKQIDQLIATHNPELMWNNLEQTPYFNYVDANGDNHTVFYENFDSISVKTSLVYDYNLAGVSMWRMGQENDMFWLAVQEGLTK